MGSGPSSLGGARSLVGLGHLVVGGAGLGFAGVLLAAGLQPHAELEGVLVVPGTLLALAAAAFIVAAVIVLRDGRRGGSLSLVLAVVELVTGVLMAWGLVVAVQGYGAFEPWRSPLLLPSLALVIVGLWGLRVEAAPGRPGRSRVKLG